MKKAILILSILTILCYIGALFFATGAVGIAQSTPTVDGASSASANASILGASLIGIVLFVVGGILSLITWILAIVKTAQIKHYGWLVAVILFTPLASLLYGAFGANDAKQPEYAYAPAAAQQYPPQY